MLTDAELEPRGRKPLDPKDRKKTITLGIKKKLIDRHGGEFELKKKIHKFLND
jgi:hypothetical protein